MGDIDDEDLEAELNELGSDGDEMDAEEIVKEEPKKVAPTPPKPVAAPVADIDYRTLALLEDNVKSFQKKIAEASSDPSKQRRLKRNIEQYDAAIKACKAGKSFDYSSLPGYESINARHNAKNFRIEDILDDVEENNTEPPPLPARSAPAPKPAPPPIPARSAPEPKPIPKLEAPTQSSSQPVNENAEIPETSEEGNF